MNFEESLARLEEITEKLESQDISLEDSLKMFEEGIRLSKFCEKKLTEAEQKLEIIKSEEIEEFSNGSTDEELDDKQDDSTEIENKSKKKKIKDKNTDNKEEKGNNFLF